jgi:hypothetical protein
MMLRSVFICPFCPSKRCWSLGTCPELTLN